MNVADFLALEVFERSLQSPDMIFHNVRAKLPIDSLRVALMAYSFGQVERDCHHKKVIVLRELQQRFARIGLYVRGINDS